MKIKLGNSPLRTSAGEATGDHVTLDGQPWLVIRNVDRLAPFLMTLASDNDHWLFVGSNGAFTAGHREPDRAMFPYECADRILRDPDFGGARSVFLVKRGDDLALWEPWRPSGQVYRIVRNLYKDAFGTCVMFEEINEDLQLAFRWTLSAAGAFGFVRSCVLENRGKNAVTVRCLDGWHRLLPSGIEQAMFARFSYLAAGYMRHESVPERALGIFTLNARITDRTDPAESLRATCAWSVGLPRPAILLCDRQLEAFRQGRSVTTEREIRGSMGAYYAVAALRLGAGANRRWQTVIDEGLDHAAVLRLQRQLRRPAALGAAVDQAVAASRDGIRRLVAAADGLQETADRGISIHHAANVLFNSMRGGTLLDGYRFPSADFRRFLQSRNAPVAARHTRWAARLPASLTLRELRTAAAKTADPQLIRITREYLPLCFGRRHGDPSRPWNWFSIRVRDDHGQPVYAFQGNWRDIFQNWEALAWSYPECLDSMIALFLNASTADGYNPYRLTREGVDWDVEEPGNPWSHIGYWGDHQIIYLLRLLETAERFQPGWLVGGLREASYAYTRVPYTIAGFREIAADPRRTIAFDQPLHKALMARAAEIGADGKLMTGPDGDVLQVSLAEKLIVPLLVKLSNLVPDGGIWLNTQRPEWNDANNALAGWGLSMVTVYQVRRYLAFLDGLLKDAGDQPLPFSGAVADLLRDLAGILRETPAARYDDKGRWRLMETLGRAGERHRRAVYRGALGKRRLVPVADVRALVADARRVVDGCIHANRRPDGLYHSYNILSLSEPVTGSARVTRLDLMLEGQVAVLGSGILKAPEATALLRALRTSDLYRADQHSYVLYPDRVLRPFLERNLLPSGAPRRAPLLAALVAAGDKRLVIADDDGRLHFQGDLTNVRDVEARLAALAGERAWRRMAVRDHAAVLALWESVFKHSTFTGRSGTFFMFEGLGSIYWHMVAKLLLAVQECWQKADANPADRAAATALRVAYYDIRRGLGFCKTPAEYGAFPADPYSHTPAHAGAQQPGMTGQVKEIILTRWGELGVDVTGGCVRFAPRLLSKAEFHAAPHSFSYVDGDGRDRTWSLPAGSLAFTFGQVPICYRLGDKAELIVERRDGRGAQHQPGDTLSAEDSRALFGRTGALRRVTVVVPRLP